MQFLLELRRKALELFSTRDRQIYGYRRSNVNSQTLRALRITNMTQRSHRHSKRTALNLLSNTDREACPAIYQLMW